MQYNVAQLLKEPTGAHRSVPVNGALAESGTPPVACAGRVELLRTHQGLLVRGLVNAEVPLTCSRCLTEFCSPTPLEVEEEFFPLVDVNTGRRLPRPAEQDGTVIDLNHILDLSEVLWQYSLAAQPIKPLCRADCPGLCQECGGDLNLGKCECDGPPLDPRWSALAGLLRKTEV